MIALSTNPDQTTMKRTPRLARLLLGSAAALPLVAAAPQQETPPQERREGQAETLAEDPAVTLTKEYDAAYEAYREKLRAADREERSKLKDEHPIQDFWPRFEELARKNNGRALLWLADNVKLNKSIKRDQRASYLEPLYRALAEHHSAAPWFGEAMDSLASNAKQFEPATAAALFETIVEKAKDSAVQATALFEGAKALEESDPKKAQAFMDRILESHRDTHTYTRAVGLRTKAADVEVGKAAPDFLGETIDGFKFHLDDYRGKVVVLDFYGFW